MNKVQKAIQAQQSWNELTSDDQSGFLLSYFTKAKEKTQREAMILINSEWEMSQSEAIDFLAWFWDKYVCIEV